MEPRQWENYFLEHKPALQRSLQLKFKGQCLLGRKLTLVRIKAWEEQIRSALGVLTA
jgi:hypothetical protein